LSGPEQINWAQVARAEEWRAALVQHLDALTRQGGSAVAEAWVDREDLPDRWLRAERQWRRWCAWRAARQAAADQGLSGVVVAVAVGAVAPKTLVERWRRLERLQKLHAAFPVTTARSVAAALSARIPEPAGTSRDPEMRFLLRELAKQRQHLPVPVLI